MNTLSLADLWDLYNQKADAEPTTSKDILEKQITMIQAHPMSFTQEFNIKILIDGGAEASVIKVSFQRY